MFIECLIKRESGTTVTINGFRYKFEEAKDGALVSNVMSQEHQNWFLRMPSFYRKYEPRHIRNDCHYAEDKDGDDEAENESDGLSNSTRHSSQNRYPVYYFNSKEEALKFLSDLKINDLRKAAKEYGVSMPVNAKKEDIVDAVAKVAYDQG